MELLKTLIEISLGQVNWKMFTNIHLFLTCSLHDSAVIDLSKIQLSNGLSIKLEIH